MEQYESNWFDTLELEPDEILISNQQVTDALIEVRGPNHIEVFVSRCMKSLYFLAIGNLAEAVKNVIQVEQECSQFYSAGSEERLKLLELVKHCLAKTYQIDSTSRTQIAIFEVILGLYGSSHEITILWRNLIVSILIDEGQYKQAIEMAKSQIAVCTLNYGEKSKEVLQARKILALATNRNGDSDLASIMYKSLIDDYQDYYGINSLETIECENLYAICHIDLERYDEGQTLLEDLLKREIEIFGPTHPNVISTRKIFVRLRGESGNYDEAIAQCRLILSELLKVTTLKDVKTYDIRRILAYWLLKSHSEEDAKETLESLLVDEIEYSGHDNIEVYKSQLILAQILTELEEFEEARILLEQVLESQTRTIGTKHQLALEARFYLSEIIGRLDEINESLEMQISLMQDLEEELTGGGIVIGSDFYFLSLRAKMQFAYWLKQDEQFEEAAEVLDQAVKGFTEWLGPTNEVTLNVRCNHAWAVHEAGDGLDAAEYYEELVEDLENVKGSTDYRTMQMRINWYRGIMWDESESYQIEAILILEIVLNDMLEVHEPEHEDVKEILEDLTHYESVLYGFRGLEYWESNLEKLINRFSNLHPSVFRTKLAIARIKRGTKDAIGAIEVLKDLRTNQEIFYGPNQIEVLKTRELIADIIFESGDEESALSEYKEIEQCYRDKHVLDVASYFTVRFKVVKLSSQSAAPLTIIELLQDIVSAAKVIFGENNYVTIDARSLLADFLFMVGNVQEAISVQESVVRDCLTYKNPDHNQRILSDKFARESQQKLGSWKLQRVTEQFGSEHPEALSAMLQYAVLLNEIYHFDDAVAVLEELMVSKERILGEYDSGLIEIRQQLIRALRVVAKPKAFLQYTKLKNHLIRLHGEKSDEVVALTQELIHFAEEEGNEDVQFREYKWILDNNIQPSQFIKYFKRSSISPVGERYEIEMRQQLEQIELQALTCDALGVENLFADLLEQSIKVFGDEHALTREIREKIQT